MALASLCVLFGHIAAKLWLVLPLFDSGPQFWPAAAAIVALGAPTVLLFLGALRIGPVRAHGGIAAWKAGHG